MSQSRLSSPAVARMLLLTLATILTVTSEQEDIEAFYQYLGPDLSYSYLQTSSTETFVPSRNLQECAMIALNSDSQFFSYNKVNYFCKNYSPNNIMTVNKNDSNEMSFYRRSEWIKIYAISMGAKSLVYNSYNNIGDPSSWNVDKCIGTFCPNFFRHPILDCWEKLPIDEVKLVIYKNQTDVVNMVFDGRNSNITNWFRYKNLKSPWMFSKPRFFSVIGRENTRRFYIANQKGCETDNGWLVIHEDGRLYCEWETSEHYPTIFYSETDSSVIWLMQRAVADSMAIFLRLK